MPRAGSADYEFVALQAANRGLNAADNRWYNRKTSLPEDGRQSNWRYVRSRRVAIMVRGVAGGLGAGYREPTRDEMKAALAHAQGILEASE